MRGWGRSEGDLANGVRVSPRADDGAFAPPGVEPALEAFGHRDPASGWQAEKHPRFLADVTGDGTPDIIGFGGPGMYVARNLYRRFRTR
ncbi:hypothetical protein [Streptomyces sp. NPDC090025]|uniref:hypothetical protein n=1 Tax=Streptomyces sp. NPDC090025 TaxID=3365922 RepID=UPI003835C05E